MFITNLLLILRHFWVHFAHSSNVFVTQKIFAVSLQDLKYWNRSLPYFNFGLKISLLRFWKFVHGSLSSDLSLRTFGMPTGKLVVIKTSFNSSNPWFMVWRLFFDESRHLSFRSTSIINLSASIFIESTSLVSTVFNPFAPVRSSLS